MRTDDGGRRQLYAAAAFVALAVGLWLVGFFGLLPGDNGGYSQVGYDELRLGADVESVRATAGEPRGAFPAGSGADYRGMWFYRGVRDDSTVVRVTLGFLRGRVFTRDCLWRRAGRPTPLCRGDAARIAPGTLRDGVRRQLGPPDEESEAGGQSVQTMWHYRRSPADVESSVVLDVLFDDGKVRHATWKG